MGVKNEQEIDTRQNWHIRLAHARQKLSLSVKETLEEVTEEDFWQDELDEQAALALARKNTPQKQKPPASDALQPPAHEKGRPGGDEPGDQGQQDEKARTAEKWPFLTLARHTGRLFRLSRRLLMAHPGPSRAKKPEMADKPAVAETPQHLALPLDTPMPTQTSAHTGELALSPSTAASEEQERVIQDETSHTGQEEATPATDVKAWPAIPLSIARSQLGQSRQRLAGHTTKIHLEIAPKTPPPFSALTPSATPDAPIAEAMPDPQSAPVEISEPAQTGVEASEITEREPAQTADGTIDHKEQIQETQMEEKKAEMIAETDKRESAAPLETAAIEMKSAFAQLLCDESEIKPAITQPLHDDGEGELAGTGSFERGGRVATIANPHIAPTSIVLVMLTASPGPVVVQYVSLKPGEGFSVHLTAPATVDTPFNYIVLAGPDEQQYIRNEIAH